MAFETIYRDGKGGLTVMSTGGLPSGSFASPREYACAEAAYFRGGSSGAAEEPITPTEEAGFLASTVALWRQSASSEGAARICDQEVEYAA